MNIREMFAPAEIAAQWTETYSNRIPYLGEGLFPERKKAGLDLGWIRGNKGLPVSLMPSAFDVQSTFRDRIGLEKLETEMPFFKEGFKLKEKDRQDLLRIGENDGAYADAIISRIYDDANNLIEGAYVVSERMAMQLLFPVNGHPGIAIKANGVDYTYSYDPDNSWYAANYFALTSPNLWTNTSSADPFASIETIQNAIRNAAGTELKTMIMNSYTFNLLKNLDALKNRFLTTTGTTVGYITKGDVLRVIGDTLGLNIAIYDKMYKNESGTAAKFVPDGYVALIPDGDLGNTWRGTTPEEADLLSGNTADVSVLGNGIAIKRIVEPDPVNVNTIVSEIVLPSYERMNEVALMKVIA